MRKNLKIMKLALGILFSIVMGFFTGIGIAYTFKEYISSFVGQYVLTIICMFAMLSVSSILMNEIYRRTLKS